MGRWPSCCQPSELAQFVNGKGSIERCMEKIWACRSPYACAPSMCQHIPYACQPPEIQTQLVIVPVCCPPQPCCPPPPCCPPKNKLASIDVVEEVIPCGCRRAGCCCQSCQTPCVQPCPPTNRRKCRIVCQEPEPPCPRPVVISKTPKWPCLPLPEKGDCINPCPPPLPPSEDGPPDGTDDDDDWEEDTGAYYFNKTTGKFEPGKLPNSSSRRPNIMILNSQEPGCHDMNSQMPGMSCFPPFPTLPNPMMTGPNGNGCGAGPSANHYAMASAPNYNCMPPAGASNFPTCNAPICPYGIPIVNFLPMQYLASCQQGTDGAGCDWLFPRIQKSKFSKKQTQCPCMPPPFFHRPLLPHHCQVQTTISTCCCRSNICRPVTASTKGSCATSYSTRPPCHHRPCAVNKCSTITSYVQPSCNCRAQLCRTKPQVIKCFFPPDFQLAPKPHSAGGCRHHGLYNNTLACYIPPRTGCSHHAQGSHCTNAAVCVSQNPHAGKKQPTSNQSGKNSTTSSKKSCGPDAHCHGDKLTQCPSAEVVQDTMSDECQTDPETEDADTRQRCSFFRKSAKPSKSNTSVKSQPCECPPEAKGTDCCDTEACCSEPNDQPSESEEKPAKKFSWKNVFSKPSSSSADVRRISSDTKEPDPCECPPGVKPIGCCDSTSCCWQPVVVSCQSNQPSEKFNWNNVETKKSGSSSNVRPHTSKPVEIEDCECPPEAKGTDCCDTDTCCVQPKSTSQRSTQEAASESPPPKKRQQQKEEKKEQTEKEAKRKEGKKEQAEKETKRREEKKEQAEKETKRKEEKKEQAEKEAKKKDEKKEQAEKEAKKKAQKEKKKERKANRDNRNRQKKVNFGGKS